MTDHAPQSAVSDDLAAAFQIEGWPVRGRLVRLGAAIDRILAAHAYPEPVAALLGEACALATVLLALAAGSFWALDGGEGEIS